MNVIKEANASCKNLVAIISIKIHTSHDDFQLPVVSRRGHSSSIFGSSSMGATIVDALDTLYIMGMEDEFNKGREWVEQNLDMAKMV